VVFKITAATVPASFPVEVQLYYDNGTVGKLDAADIYQSSVTVTSTSSTNYFFSFPEAPADQKVLLVYKTALGCYSKIVAPTAAADITTTQKNVCGTRVDFSITGAAGSLINYVFPITVNMHYDPNDNGVVDKGEKTVIGSATATAASTTYSITIPDASQNVILVYASADICLDKTVKATRATGSITTTQRSYCGKRVDFQVTGATLDAATYAFPITAELHYDLNGNGSLDAGEEAVQGSKVITGSSTTTYSFTVPDPSQNLLVVYRTAQSCFTTSATPVTTNDAVTMTLGGQFVNPTTVNYFIVNAATNATAYPLKLQVFEDKNKNGSVDNGEVEIGITRNLQTAPETGTTYNATTAAGSYAVVIATSTTGCSSASLSISNSQIVLPVHFRSVSATRNKEKVIIKWETATETNNRGFNVQRNDKGTWKNIAFAFTQANGGNSTSALSYQYTDLNTSKGLSQYRIQQVDMDGKATYSRICAVNGEASARSVIVYPNPSIDGKVNLLFEDNSERNVIISDMSGRVVKQFKGITNNELSVDLRQSGMYTIQITNLAAATITTEKVVVKK